PRRCSGRVRPPPAPGRSAPAEAAAELIRLDCAPIRAVRLRLQIDPRHARAFRWRWNVGPESRARWLWRAGSLLKPSYCLRFPQPQLRDLLVARHWRHLHGPLAARDRLAWRNADPRRATDYERLNPCVQHRRYVSTHDRY